MVPATMTAVEAMPAVLVKVPARRRTGLRKFQMRKSIRRRIDFLHAEIQRLIEWEKEAYLRENPDTDGRSSLLRQIEFTKMEQYRLCPQDRDNMHYAAATFPTLPK